MKRGISNRNHRYCIMCLYASTLYLSQNLSFHLSHTMFLQVKSTLTRMKMHLSNIYAYTHKNRLLSVIFILLSTHALRQISKMHPRVSYDFEGGPAFWTGVIYTGRVICKLGAWLTERSRMSRSSNRQTAKGYFDTVSSVYYFVYLSKNSWNTHVHAIDSLYAFP